MECNKEEAERAMNIASRKMAEKDYINAKKFAYNAHNLYPPLEGLEQLIMTVDRHVMGAKRIGGEADWYGILGVEPFADEETVRKQYHKMSLALHPDINKSQGAEAAFKLLSVAWTFLSDPLKKSSYDLMRRQVVDFERYSRTRKETQQNEPTVVSSASGSSVKKDTFWTQCDKCKTCFEYVRFYHNSLLRCIACHESFVAIETTTPPETAEKAATEPAASASHQVVPRDTPNQGAQDGPKIGFVEPQERDVAARGNTDPRNVKKPRTDGSQAFGPFTGNWSSQTMLPNDIMKAVVNKAHQDIFVKLPNMISETVKDVAKAMEREKKYVNVTTSKAMEKTTSVPEVSVIDVPDSDFHNFDLDRSENSFGEDEVWAAYDNEDGMPRYYARVKKVVSLEPFNMRVTWLKAKTCSEFSPNVEWITSGFVKTCGKFRTGKYESTSALNAFSHKVDFTKGAARGVICILPKKGQVWALYRNWSREWNMNTLNVIVQKYDMVEVLEDYTEKKGSVAVALLLKVQGFRSVFRRSTEKEDMRKVVKGEMFRFSHQVPCYVLTGKEADNAPEGCLELDPAAAPCEAEKEKSESVAKGLAPNEA
ncbi:unnamed protein product [Cochlearia groenlandica]